MAIKDATAKVLNNVDILNVIGEDTHLVRQGNGNEYMGSCPFHTDRHPSLSVNSQKQVFHCFSCGRSGNVISYIEERDEISFFEALTRLANEYDISLEGIISQEDEEVSKKRKAYYDLLQTVQEYFVEQLPKHQKELDYLIQERKLNKETIERFGIGFDDGNLYKYLSSTEHGGYLLTELSENGLIKLTNNSVQDFFNQRITFPLKDERGYVVGFSARSLNEQPKYRNSLNNQFFTKNQIIYNFFDTKQQLKELEKKSVYLFEGQNDVISAVMAGKKNSIASLGTALTDNQILKILKLTDDIIISYDGDEAGQHAIIRAANNFKIINPMVKLSVVQLPNKLDPDDYRRKYSIEQLEKELNHTTPIVEYLIGLEFEKFKQTDQSIPEKSRLYDKAVEIIHHFANDIEQQMYLNFLNETFHIEGKAIQTKPVQKYDDNLKPQHLNTSKEETPVILKHNNNEHLNTIENKLLSYIVHNPEIFDDENIRLVSQYFRNADYKNILNSLFLNSIKLNEYQKLLLENARNNNINFTYDSFLLTLKDMYDNFDYDAALKQIKKEIQKAKDNHDQKALLSLVQQEIDIKKAKK